MGDLSSGLFVGDAVEIGEVVAGKYKLIRLLGKGGMGAVYEAINTRVDRPVALKFLLPELLDHGELVIRFMREAKTAAAIGSEHIVDVYDIEELEEGGRFLVMERLVGQDLGQLLDRGGPLSVERATTLAIQACQGLHAAHRRGIIHRDLKPENLFLTHREDGTEWIKILDFGIAKFKNSLAELNPKLTETGIAVGTPYYMSLEQLNDASDVDHQADIYAMGVILYELLTGAPPYTGQSLTQLIIMINEGRPKPPRALRPDLPEALEEVVLTAMAREPYDRYGTALELAEALAPFCPRAGSLLPSVSDSRTALGFAKTGVTGGLEGASEGEEDHVETLPEGLAEAVEAAPRELTTEGESQEAVAELGPQRSGSRWRVVALTLVVAALSAALLVLILESGEQGAGATTSAPDEGGGLAAPSGSTEEEPMEGVTIKVRVEPSQAKLMIDGVEVTGSPYAGVFARDTLEHRVEVTAEGYERHAQFLRFNADHDLEIRLRPVTSPGDGGPPTKTTSPRRPPPRERAEASAAPQAPTAPIPQQSAPPEAGPPPQPEPSKSAPPVGLVPPTKRKIADENPYPE